MSSPDYSFGNCGIGSSTVGIDECASGTINDLGDASTIGTISQALKAPLGSQLTLLNAMNSGDPFLNYGRTSNMRASNTMINSAGYNTLTGAMPQIPTASGNFFGFTNAYGLR